LACTLGLGGVVFRLEAGELELGLDVAAESVGDGEVPAESGEGRLQLLVRRRLAAELCQATEARLESHQPVTRPVEDLEVLRQSLGRPELLGDDLLRRLAPLLAVPPEQPSDGRVTHGDAVRFGEPGGDLPAALPLAREPQHVRDEAIGDAPLALSLCGHRWLPVAVRRDLQRLSRTRT
jgi:hypothetical protein